jgi:hypothetical protein
MHGDFRCVKVAPRQLRLLRARAEFWVDRAESTPGSLAVIGRCFFGPIRTGLVFDGVVSARNGAWSLSNVVACCLCVAEIRLYGRLADAMGQVLSGRLVLSGNASAGLERDSLLVSRGSPDDGWMLRGGGGSAEPGEVLADVGRTSWVSALAELGPELGGVGAA